MTLSLEFRVDSIASFAIRQLLTQGVGVAISKSGGISAGAAAAIARSGAYAVALAEGYSPEELIPEITVVLQRWQDSQKGRVR